MEKSKGQRFAETFSTVTDAVSHYLIRLAELIALAAAFDAASELSQSAVLDWFTDGLRVLVGLHFATIYVPVFKLLDQFAGDLNKDLKLVILALVSFTMLPIVLITSIELSEAVTALALASGIEGD